ncbi:MAG TPA: phosphoribosylformylglycinamidine cyclo-ligase [Halanaerobiales bacterium]|nr:phosphoribosylformylglycinamidine cyclo-ligase [Halanaerobiales bacterium]
MGLSYKDAGVDIKKGEEAVKQINEMVKSTYNENVVTELGGFGGLFNLDLKEYNEPILAAATDGVGTKLKLAFLADKHDTIGIDLVAMSVNDLVTLGAKPLFFLDYLATGNLDVKQFNEVVAGIVQGCKEAGCALLGGETAEMPDFYPDGEYDTAGFCVGIVDKKEVIDGSEIKKGDTLIGIASNGIHSNGYSLVRKLFIKNNEENEQSLLENLLKPTKIYVKPILELIDKYNIKGIAHITGGGLKENVPRILPTGYTAEIATSTFPTPEIFKKIQKKGNIESDEMYRTFNMGLGMVLVVNKKDIDKVLKTLKELGETAYEIGEIDKGDKGLILNE